MTKRAIMIETKDTGTRLELSKCALIKLKPAQAEFIHLDKLKDGTWRLVYTGSTIPDITQVEALRIIRED